jgi:hypothetical protein
MSESDGIVGLACFFGTSRLFGAKPVRAVTKAMMMKIAPSSDANGFTRDQPSISAG